MQTQSAKFSFSLIFALLLLVSLMSTGCGSRFTARDIPTSVWCHANGFAEKPIKKGARYWVINASGAQGDLEFKEYGKILGSALTDLGYSAAESLAAADVAILLSYGVSEPRSFEYTTSTPVFEYVAGKTTTYTAVAVTADSAAGASVRVTQPSQLLYAGQKTVTTTEDVYTRYFRCEAVAADIVRNENRVEPLWVSTVRSSGSLSDLRVIFPLMVASSVDIYGIDTDIELPRRITTSDEYAYYLKFGKYPERHPLKFLAGGYRKAILSISGSVPEGGEESVKRFLYSRGIRPTEAASDRYRDTMSLTFEFSGGPRYAVKITAKDGLHPDVLLGVGGESDFALSQPPVTDLLEKSWGRLVRHNADLVGCRLP
jgi:hypothetical protein